MKCAPAFHTLSILALVFSPSLSSVAADEAPAPKLKSAKSEFAQVPTWSSGDLRFFLHGSMSTEVAPETVLRAFIRTYPDLFPTPDLSHLGLIPDPEFGWPVGFSRSK